MKNQNVLADDQENTIPSWIFQQRVQKLLNLLRRKKLIYLLIENGPNKTYLTGFTGSAGWALVGERNRYLFVDSRYFEQAKRQSPHLEVIDVTEPFSEFFKEFSKNLSGRIGFESHNITHKQLLDLRRSFRGLTPKPTVGLVEQLRAVKDEKEVELIKKSVSIADIAFQNLLHLLKPGMTEKEIAWELEKLMREAGAEKAAWHPLIAAFGSNSSMPHYAAGEEKLKMKEMILLDFGAVVGGYHSDISRVVFLGKPSPEQRKVYQLVLEAQKRAKEQISHKVKAARVDRVAKEVIENQNYPAYQHGLSHGVGLEIHELPRVSQISKDVLEEGNVISVEPGIYIPGWGGVRIEDLVLVKKDGVETLTESPKEISEVTI